jgi:hypothetical protein
MPTAAVNKQVRNASTGFNTIHTSQVVPTVALSPQTIFTVSGGMILAVSLIGHITTVMSATAYTLTVGLTPTEGAGTSAPAALASAGTLTSLEVGTNVCLNAAAAGALQVGTNASTLLLKPAPVLVNTGAITLTGSATQTGVIRWVLTWVAVDDAASVVAV